MNIFEGIISGNKPQQSVVTPEALANRAYSVGATNLKEQSFWKSTPQQTRQQAWDLIQKKQGPAISADQNVKPMANLSAMGGITKPTASKIIPEAKASSIDEEKVKNFIEYSKSQGKTKDEIKNAYNKGLEKGIFSKKEESGFKEYAPMADPLFKTTGFEQGDPFALGKSLAGAIGNVPTSLYNIGAGAVNLAGNLIERPQETVQDIVGGVKQMAGQVAEQPISETAKGAYKFLTEEPTSIMPLSAGSAAGKVASKAAKSAGTTIAETPEYAASIATGLSREAQKAIKETPELYKQARTGELERGSLFEQAKTAIDQRSEQFSELGKAYEPIRKSGVVFDKNNAYDAVAKAMGDIKDRDLTFEDRATMQKAMQYINEYGDTMDANDMFTLRKKLSSLASFQSEATTEGKNLIRKMRSNIGETMKERIPGLRELDAKYAPEAEFMDKLKGIIYNKDGSVKENAISAISNAAGKGKEFKLERLETVMPGITDKIKALKAFEEVQGIAEAKTGSIMRQLSGVSGGTLVGGPAGAVVGFILTSPKTAAYVLEKYGMAKSKIKSILSSGGKLTEQQTKETIDAIKSIDKSEVEKSLMDSAQSLGLDNAGAVEMPIKPKTAGGSPKVKEGKLVKQTSSESSLIEEAKKYKSAEEFVKSQGEQLYHGTTKNIKGNIKSSGVKGNMGENQIPGIYATNNIRTANYFSSKNGIQTHNPINIVLKGKILEIDNEKSLKDKFKTNNLQDIADKAKREGYDAIKLGEKANGLEGNEYIILNEGSIKTKQQLIDIYNKAHKGFNHVGTTTVPKLYHGTTGHIDKFVSDYFGKGSGGNLMGKGVYLTDNPEIAKYFTTQITERKVYRNFKKLYEGKVSDTEYQNKLNFLGRRIEDLVKGKRNIIEVAIPEDFKMLDLSEKADLPQAMLEKFMSSLNEQNKRIASLKSVPVMVKLGLGDKLHEFLKSEGYKGIKFSPLQKGDDGNILSGNNYVIFNPEDAKIVKNTIYSILAGSFIYEGANN